MRKILMFRSHTKTNALEAWLKIFCEEKMQPGGAKIMLRYITRVDGNVGLIFIYVWKSFEVLLLFFNWRASSIKYEKTWQTTMEKLKWYNKCDQMELFAFYFF
ncbi:hypothetical protein MRB53_023257 [Persea americana]|uniref:Uncharacterized protein n=1 Tax=Persea americana TaxID=3435 RepID=A0ACC2L8X6_PERAE|nr:hypothetical protein MRB53_023257 [Persea americana]